MCISGWGYLRDYHPTVDGSDTPNNHLGWCKNLVNNRKKLPFPQLVNARFLVAINSSTPPPFCHLPRTWSVQAYNLQLLHLASYQHLLQLRLVGKRNGKLLWMLGEPQNFEVRKCWRNVEFFSSVSERESKSERFIILRNHVFSIFRWILVGK